MEPEPYARYQLQVWEESVAAARRALGAGASAEDLRRDANRRFVRACLTRRQWSARQGPPEGASAAQIAVLRSALV